MTSIPNAAKSLLRGSSRRSSLKKSERAICALPGMQRIASWGSWPSLTLRVGWMSSWPWLRREWDLWWRRLNKLRRLKMKSSRSRRSSNVWKGPSATLSVSKKSVSANSSVRNFNSRRRLRSKSGRLYVRPSARPRSMRSWRRRSSERSKNRMK